jgi:hypothetical protein
MKARSALHQHKELKSQISSTNFQPNLNDQCPKSQTELIAACCGEPSERRGGIESVRISKDIQEGKIVVTFAYDPKFVAMVKTIEGHSWHPDKKYWSFPHSEDILKGILSVFKSDKKLPIVLGHGDVIGIF